MPPTSDKRTPKDNANAYMDLMTGVITTMLSVGILAFALCNQDIIDLVSMCVGIAIGWIAYAGRIHNGRGKNGN